jgi:hypothetical protein
VVAQRRGVLGLDHRRAVLGGQPGVVGGALDAQARVSRHAEPVLDQPELGALEARRGHQVITEVQEVQRRHRLKHLELAP